MVYLEEPRERPHNLIIHTYNYEKNYIISL